MVLRKTKIVCTMGPTVKDLGILEQLILSGMDVARFNFSHGDHDYHREMMALVRQASANVGQRVAILLDTKGPEIRTGNVKDKVPFDLVAGALVTLTTDDEPCTSERISISYKALPREISPGKHVYIADGTIDLEVNDVDGNDIHCVVRQGGQNIGSHKNVNVIGVRTSLPGVTEKDKADILFGIEQGIDFIAASFVRKAADVVEIKKILKDNSSHPIDIIAKIEDEEGVSNLEEIINVANGIMVARGDLGVQLSMEMIPLVQKRIIHRCSLFPNKPVITATQMLDSMIRNPVPTRAEVSDVANAVFDGTDAIMLSGETASGKYPVGSVKTMHKIAMSVESSPEYRLKMRNYFKTFGEEDNIAYAVTKSAFLLASNIHASAFIAPSLRGNTPKMLSKYRPSQRILAMTTTEQVARNLKLYWGVYPMISTPSNSSDKITNNAVRAALKLGLVSSGDRVVMIAGVPINSPLPLNSIRVHMIANVLAKGKVGKTAGSLRHLTGRVMKCETLEEAARRLEQGKSDRDSDGSHILVLKSLDAGCDYAPVIPQCSAIVLEEYSSVSWDLLLLLNPSLALLSGVSGAFSHIEDEITITVDIREKLVYEGVFEEAETGPRYDHG